MELIKPKPITIADGDGVEKEYILSRLFSDVGREVMAKYPFANMPKLGEYSISEDIMFKLMAHVGVEIDGKIMPLSSRALVRNHVPDCEALAKLEWAMLEYNFSFLRDGTISDFLQECALNFLPKILKTLTASLEQSSATTKQPTMS